MSSTKKMYVKKYEEASSKVTISENEVRVWISKDSIPVFRLKTKGKVTVSTPRLLTGIIDVIVE